MKEMYVELMDKVLSAYSEEQISAYIDEVRKEGVTEHGFPRLIANIGFLISLGRRREMLPRFIEMMELSLGDGLDRKTANEFSVRELCACIQAVEKCGAVPGTYINKWKKRLGEFDYRLGFTIYAEDPNVPVSNWGAFAGLSELTRGKYLGIDTSDFVDTQIASQLLSFDENGMYKDKPGNPIVYDMITRILLSAMLFEGYDGKYRADVDRMLSLSDRLTLSMQSVTGETAYGGRSNQFLHNEASLCYFCEMAAARYARAGDSTTAGRFKRAAQKAAENMMRRLKREPISHVKNAYPSDSLIGCEEYAYFNKYMITASSMLYFAYLYADDGIISAENAEGDEAFSLSGAFHKTFLRAGGYFVEIDTDGDPHYDASGIGRIHREGAPSEICLSVPFPKEATYKTESKNSGAASICSFVGELVGADGVYLASDIGADGGSAFVTLTETRCGVTLCEKIRVSESGVDIEVSKDAEGIMLPALEFDGGEYSEITRADGELSVEYKGSRLVYAFDGELSLDFASFCNRNGRYRVYKMRGKKVNVKIL